MIIILNDTISKWAKNTLLVRSFQGFDEYANAVLASSSDEVSYNVIINNTARRVRDQKGALVTSPTQIYLSGSPNIHLED